VGTVLVDDPLLTDRTGEPRRRKLLRVVADSKLRIPLKARIVKSANGDVLVATTQPVTSPKARSLARAGIEVVRIRGKRGRVDLDALVAELGRREILNLMLEAGAEMNAAALESGIVDRVVAYYAPRVLGVQGVPFAAMRLKPNLQAPTLENVRSMQYGSDIVIEGWLRDVYGDHGTRRKN
jgi:diaminohydroxyphosphoribosylaminopyrimidine deaminase/5-amino-6-(5-phosphoribosylamino)uracil reductase